MAKSVNLLGFADGAHGAALRAALDMVDGPPVIAVYAASLAALAQAEPHCDQWLRRRGATATLKDLRTVQCRLEVACQHGPFLPADPAHNRCPATDIERRLEAAADDITHALAGPGRHHQWDIVLRWPAEAVVAARREEIASHAIAGGGGRQALAEAVQAALARDRNTREAGLRASLAGIALATLPAGAGQTETGITVLLPAGAEAQLERVLQALPQEVSDLAEADLRGPLPPISFASVRIDDAAPGELLAAWRALELPEEVDCAALRKHWRTTAARLHPDRGAKSDAPMAEAGAAFRLLRDLLPPAAGAMRSLDALQREAAGRMRVRLVEMDTDMAA